MGGASARTRGRMSTASSSSDVMGNPAAGHVGHVGAVHSMVVTGRGEMAYVDTWNSHQAL
jgi:hypothetical protein